MSVLTNFEIIKIKHPTDCNWLQANCLLQTFEYYGHFEIVMWNDFDIPKFHLQTATSYMQNSIAIFDGLLDDFFDEVRLYRVVRITVIFDNIL